MTATRTHDLVRLADPAAALTGADPAWVGESLAGAPWAVVRRGTAPDGYVAVGVRGPARHQRHAAQVPVGAVQRVVRPERLRPGPDTATDRTPALAALRVIGPALDGLDLAWGPVGGVGFELATGRPATTPASDLDVVVRCDRLPGTGWAAALLDTLRSLPAPVDCLIETAAGGVALAELATGTGRVLLRTAGGACLVDPARIRAA